VGIKNGFRVPQKVFVWLEAPRWMGGESFFVYVFVVYHFRKPAKT